MHQVVMVSYNKMSYFYRERKKEIMETHTTPYFQTGTDLML